MKDFESFLVDKGLTNRRAYRLMHLIAEARHLEEITHVQSKMLSAIIDSPKLTPIESKQFPLDAWFSQMGWVRGMMAKENKKNVYNRIASSKAVMVSFKTTVSEIMRLIQETVSDLADALVIVSPKDEQLDTKDKASIRRIQQDIMQIIKRNEISYSSASRSILLHDWGSKSGGYKQGKLFDDEFIVLLKEFSVGRITTPPHNIAEELCFYWLMCAQTVQASNARTLKYDDFILFGTKTRTTHFTCEYFKTRAKAYKSTDTIDVGGLMGKVMFRHITKHKFSDSLITLTEKTADNAVANFNGTVGQLLALVNLEKCCSNIKFQLDKYNASSVFLELIKCVINYGTTHAEVKKIAKRARKRVTRDEYESQVRFWLPGLWFTGSMIKTGAVHADSGNLRVGALVNNNSHSTTTEHEVYYSAQNSEYQNMYGRIMRLAMEDIEGVAFKPSVHEVDSRITERKLRTEILCETTGIIKPFFRSTDDELVTQNDSEKSEESDSITVTQSVETVVNFLHYIEQSCTHYHALSAKNCTFLEKHVIPTAEWMESLLDAHFPKEIKNKGQTMFKKYRAMLPPLFSSQLGS